MAGTLYSEQFFAGQMDGSARSASVVVPVILSICPARSVVDVGCGVGTWAAEFLSRGVDAWGVDGDYVSRDQLRIPAKRYIARDLSTAVGLSRRFDLAVSLEVAEHLPPDRAPGFVHELTQLAPCVVFSAAIPGPTGTGHINPQFLPFWVGLFRECGYVALDPIRDQVWGRDDVEWFYQENIVVFASPDHPVVKMGFPSPKSMIHQTIYEQALVTIPPLGQIVRMLPTVISRSVRYRLRNMLWTRRQSGHIGS